VTGWLYFKRETGNYSFVFCHLGVNFYPRVPYPLSPARKFWRVSNFIHLCFWWDWSLNLKFHACKAGALPYEPHLQSVLLWLFWRWGSLELFAWNGLNLDFSDLSYQVARIAGMSHWWPTYLFIYLFIYFSFFFRLIYLFILLYWGLNSGPLP
jgi:hypothetical protein